MTVTIVFQTIRDINTLYAGTETGSPVAVLEPPPAPVQTAPPSPLTGRTSGTRSRKHLQLDRVEEKTGANANQEILFGIQN